MAVPVSPGRVPAWLGAGASIIVLGAAAFGVHRAMRSDLFLIRAVEVEPIESAHGAPEGIPLTRDVVRELAGIRPGRDNLFGADLGEVERRILSYPWVRAVRVEKRLPSTLRIHAEARVPVAALSDRRGSLSYVSGDGTVFAPFDFRVRGDVPVLAGLEPGDAENLRQAVSIVKAWETSGLARVSELSALGWSEAGGFRAVASYRLGGGNSAPGVARLTVRLGMGSNDDREGDLRRLSRVIDYLRLKSVAAHQILMGDGRKIVVSAAPDS